MKSSFRRTMTCAVTALLGTALPAGSHASTLPASKQDQLARSTRPFATAAPRASSQVDARVPPRVREIIVENLKVDEKQVTYEAHLVDDLKVDSLGCVNLIFSLEERFGIEIPDEDAERFLRVRDIVEYLRKRSPVK